MTNLKDDIDRLNHDRLQRHLGAAQEHAMSYAKKCNLLEQQIAALRAALQKSIACSDKHMHEAARRAGRAEILTTAVFYRDVLANTASVGERFVWIDEVKTVAARGRDAFYLYAVAKGSLCDVHDHENRPDSLDFVECDRCRADHGARVAQVALENLAKGVIK